MSEPLVVSSRALLFDMDGTLVDSTAVVEVAWRAIAERFGVDPAIMLPTIHGVRAVESIRRWAPPGTDIDAVVAELGEFEIASAGETVAVPGAVELLNAMPVAAHALVTSAELPLAVARMGGAGLRLPQFVVTAEDVPRGKPAPDVYLLAAEMLGVEPRDAVVFEDAEAGIRAGLTAGMRVVVVGGHESPSTQHLPRIADYDGAGIAVGAGGELEVVLPHRL
jgi:sugar-phosphatase